jgi:hypothetical protein
MIDSQHLVGVKVLLQYSSRSTIGYVPREGKTLKLSAALRDELEQFVHTFYGENLSEVIMFILRQWVEVHRKEGPELRRQREAKVGSNSETDGLVIDTTSE